LAAAAGYVARLDLGIFADTKHEGTVGRVDVEPNVARLVDKQRTGGELDGLDAIGCRPKARQMRPTLEVEMPM
jgi:hypothetical protein